MRIMGPLNEVFIPREHNYSVTGPPGAYRA